MSPHLAVALVAFLAGASPKFDTLLVHCAGGTFGVKEPAGWRGHTDALARRYGVDVVFIKASETPEAHNVSIRVRVNEKQDENVAEDLAADANSYKERYRRIELRALSVSHPQYQTVAQLFFSPGEFAEYVAYVTPGTVFPYSFSVALSTPGGEAPPGDLSAFREVLSSLRAIRRKK